MASQFFVISLLSVAITTWVQGLVATPEMPELSSVEVQPKVCAPAAGCMLGVRLPGYQSEQFEAFLGVPYALPPLDELRFSNPKAYPKWAGLLNATAAKADCIQKNYLVPNPQVYGSEDCLYLNVYRPMLRRKEMLPVLVHIFGGGWFSGSANAVLHGPEYFLDTGEVILVTFAYRLGAFGFLSTSDSNMPGNFGLKDQNIALRWVHKNIAAFGGDPKMVTIFGQSAGAISVHMHMLSRQSAGLFRHAISMSGTANVPFAITDEPLAQAKRVAELCNITNVAKLSSTKLARALRSIDAVTLVNAGDGLKYWDVDHLTNFRPVVERGSERDAFLTEHPQTTMASGRYKPVPWLVGGVPQEGAVRVLAILNNDTLRTAFNANFNALVTQMIDLPSRFSADERQSKVKLILEEYFQGQHELNDDTAQGFLDMISDRGFKQPYFNAINTFVHTVNTNKYPIYLYQFNYSGPYTYASIYTGLPLNASLNGVVHCDDLIYLFRSPMLFPDFEKDSLHAAVMAALVGDFVHFAKFGAPSDVDTLQACSNLTFNRLPDTICDYRYFTNVRNATHESFTIKTDNTFNVRRMQFWNSILA